MQRIEFEPLILIRYRVCKRLKCKREKKKKKRLIFKRGTHSSSASESEQEDSIGNEAEREVPLDSQEKEAVESDGTVGCEQIIVFCKNKECFGLSPTG